MGWRSTENAATLELGQSQRQQDMLLSYPDCPLFPKKLGHSAFREGVGDAVTVTLTLCLPH